MNFLRYVQPQVFVTKLSSARGPLGKCFSLDEGGGLISENNGNLYSGTAETIAFRNLEEFRCILQALRIEECLAYGITGYDQVEVVTKSALPQNPGAIARDRAHFYFNAGPAIMMLDHDCNDPNNALTPDELKSALIKACPPLGAAGMLWCASASSNIVNEASGDELRGTLGQRIYIAVQDGRDIPRAGTALYERLWLSGAGYCDVSNAGSSLLKSLIDAHVWQPERIDFAAGAYCYPPLKQQRPASLLWNPDAAPFDSRCIPALSPDERAELARLWADAKNQQAGKCKEKRQLWLDSRSQAVAQQRGLQPDQVREALAKAAETAELAPDFVLYPESGGAVTVEEILAERQRWHAARFADPLEPDYRNDKRIAWANLCGAAEPYIHSHAHGGQRYVLKARRTIIQVRSGDLSTVADQCLDEIRARGELYDYGRNQIVRIEATGMHPANHIWMRDYLGRNIRFEKFAPAREAWAQIDAPETVAKYICERVGERGLPKLRRIITSPTMSNDGRVIDTPGYDPETGLFYLSDEPLPPTVPRNPGVVAIRRALEVLWKPFREFPFADDVSRGVVLSALLSAVVRPGIDTCPGFAFDAPAAGSGKTLLARCIAELAGSEGGSYAPPSDDEEARKVLFAALREGNAAIIWDNVIAPMGGAALNMFLTEPKYMGRILGRSETESLPNTSLFLVTGNNLRFLDDTIRRMLVCRIDARSEKPYLRQFDFSPLTMVKETRLVMSVAALTLIRAYQVSGQARCAPGNVASFEQWDALVRQTVCWVRDLDLGPGLEDPIQSIDRNIGSDPHKVILGEILEAWYEAFGFIAVPASAAILPTMVGRGGTAAEAMARETAMVRLKQALGELEGDGSGAPLSAKRLGWWLRRHEGEIVNGKRFQKERDTKMNQQKWRVESVESIEGSATVAA